MHEWPDASRGVTIATGVGPATDVFAFGLVALELLGGTTALEYWGTETTADQLLKVALEPRLAPRAVRPELVAELPAAFDAWFLRCLDHDARRRFASMAEAMAELAAALGTEAVAAELGGLVDTNAVVTARISVTVPLPTLLQDTVPAPSPTTSDASPTEILRRGPTRGGGSGTRAAALGAAAAGLVVLGAATWRVVGAGTYGVRDPPRADRPLTTYSTRPPSACAPSARS